MGEWMEVLRTACSESSQSKVAARLGVSPAQVNQTLRGKYRGNLRNLEQRVRGVLMRETVDCPVLGEISKRRCCDEQRRPFAPTNPQRVAVYKACRNGCEYAGGVS